MHDSKYALEIDRRFDSVELLENPTKLINISFTISLKTRFINLMKWVFKNKNDKNVEVSR